MLAIADKPHEVYNAHRHIAAISRMRHRDAMAIEHRRLATEAARQQGLTILLLMALGQEAQSLINVGRIEEAATAIEEVVAIVRRENDASYEQILARTMILRAECQIAEGGLTEAQADLDSAYEYFLPRAKVEFAAGIQSDLASWWAAIGQLRTARQDFEGAIDAWQQAVALDKSVNSLSHCADVYTAASVASTLGGLADAQSRAGKIQEARDTLAERSAILDLLGLPDGEG